MPKFVDSEQNIEKLFPIGTEFFFEGKTYKVLLSGKPRPPKGECKTDLYIKAIATDGETREIKISVKQEDADFIENKMSLTRAYEIFGTNASNIIKECLLSIKDSFINDFLVYFKAFQKTEAHTIKLGWKFELLNKSGGQKSGFIALSEQQKYDVFAGINLPDEKKNSYVGSYQIENSGIANYMLILHKDNISQDDCLMMLQPIEEYSKTQSIYFACKALNYRFDKQKWDGPRPLSVYVNWFINNEKLDAELVFDKPLEHNGNEIGHNLKILLKELRINAFDDLREKLAPAVKSYRGKEGNL